MSLTRKSIQKLEKELVFAKANFPPMRSLHEAYAIILEEVDELWEEIKTKQRDIDKIEMEAIQIAAMAIRLVDDLIYKCSDNK